MGKRHAAIIASIGVSLVGVHDINPDVGETLPQGIPLFRNAQEMLAKLQPDLYVIATTADGHYFLAQNASENGVRRILLEKPAFCSLGEADQLIKKISTESTVAINFCRRYYKTARFVQQIQSQGHLGTLVSTNIIGGNIGLAANGCHWIDLHMYLSGSTGISVSFSADDHATESPRGINYEDISGVGFFEFSDGSKLILNISNRCGHGLKSIFVFEFGVVTLDELSGMGSITYRSGDRWLPSSKYGHNARQSSVFAGAPKLNGAIEHIYRSLLAGGEVPSLHDARENTSFLLAANLSAEREGSKVFLDQHLPLARRFRWS